MAAQKIIFFTAGEVATAGEKTDIDNLNALVGSPFEVVVRNGSIPPVYGYGVEEADYVSGTVPATGYEGVPVADPDNPPSAGGTTVGAQVPVYWGQLDLFLAGDTTITDNILAKVTLPATAAIVINNAQNNTGITVTGTAGSGKKAVFTVANGAITNIDLT